MPLMNNEKPYGTYYNATVKRGPVKVGKKKLFLVAGGIVAILIFVLSLAGSLVNSGGPEEDIALFGAKMAVLSEISNDAKKEIQSREINQINTNARLLFTSDKNNLNDVLNEIYGYGGIPGDAIALQTDPEVETNLEEARLLNKYDIQYRAIMQEKITKAITAGLKAKKSSKSKTADAAIQTAIDNLKSIQKQLDETDL